MRKILFNDDWHFLKEDVNVNCFIKDKYELINLPHTYNNIDGQDGGDDYYRGYATYVKEFEYKVNDDNPKCFIEFRGVGQSCDVYLNGTYIGNHQGGYSTFRFELTDYLKEDNLLVVKSNNLKNETVYPQMADFTFYGGIYRDVYLIECASEHFDLLDHGSNGLIVTPKVLDDKAEIEVEAWVSGGDKIELNIENIKVEMNIENRYGKVMFNIDKPHLWDGLNDPYLYNLSATLLKNNEIKDKLDLRFGIREFSFDPNKGFFLNGKAYPLRGVSKHQDRLNVGNAVSKENLKEDMQLIKEVGANTIRLAHYQHDQYFYDLCDEVGMVVWAEIPYISRHMPNGKENTLSQMEELIKQNYNHPSIVCWGLSNEITIGGGAESDSLLNNHRELNDLVHKLDKTRPTTMAHVMSQDPHGTIIGIPDIASYNHYYGWYVGDTSGYAKFFDKFHQEHPNYCIGLSEYGADANPKLHSNKPKKGDYTEEYQCKYHEEVLEFINEREYLWATHVWNMFDFAADARREGDNLGKNQKGLVTMDRKLKKDSFYLYKAYWNKEDKFVHICSRRYINRHEEETEIKVYSNLDEVSLYVDNQLIETKKADKIFRFVVPIKGEHNIKAVSGEYLDEIVIKHVPEKDESYVLKETGAMNWFNQEEIKEDYYSIADTIESLLSNEETAVIVKEIMEQVSKSNGTLSDSANNNPNIIESLKQMQLATIFTLSGGGIKNEDIKKINEKLQSIKK